MQVWCTSFHPNVRWGSSVAIGEVESTNCKRYPGSQRTIWWVVKIHFTPHFPALTSLYSFMINGRFPLKCVYSQTIFFCVFGWSGEELEPLSNLYCCLGPHWEDSPWLSWWPLSLQQKVGWFKILQLSEPLFCRDYSYFLFIFRTESEGKSHEQDTDSKQYTDRGFHPYLLYMHTIYCWGQLGSFYLDVNVLKVIGPLGKGR